MRKPTVIYRYYNDGTPMGVLPYYTAVHEEDLDGTDKLTVTCRDFLWKRERLVWRDDGGVWHEHMVDTTERRHTSGGIVTTVTCSNSISELFGIVAGGTKRKTTVYQHLAALLEGTRWEADKCANFGFYELETWHKSVRACIGELVDLCGGELVTTIEVGNGGVTSRKVGIAAQHGASNSLRSHVALRQFTWGRNMTNARRESGQEEVYTAVVGYGAKVDQQSADEYAPRITATAQAGYDTRQWCNYDASGNAVDNVLVYTDDSCDDYNFLLRQCQKMAAVYGKPLIRYEFEVVQDDDSSWSDVRIGTYVSCVDTELGLDVVQRVSHIRRNLGGKGSCTITIGERANPLVEKFKAQEKAEKRNTGNDMRTSSDYSPISTGGNYGGGSDGWVHQIDGVTVKGGVVNFITSDTGDYVPSQNGTADEWGADGGASSLNDEVLDYWGTAGNANGH